MIWKGWPIFVVLIRNWVLFDKIVVLLMEYVASLSRLRSCQIGLIKINVGGDSLFVLIVAYFEWETSHYG